MSNLKALFLAGALIAAPAANAQTTYPCAQSNVAGASTLWLTGTNVDTSPAMPTVIECRVGIGSVGQFSPTSACYYRSETGMFRPVGTLKPTPGNANLCGFTLSLEAVDAYGNVKGFIKGTLNLDAYRQTGHGGALISGSDAVGYQTSAALTVDLVRAAPATP